MRNVVGTYLEELIQEECEPVGQHLLGDRLRSDTQREKKKNTITHVDESKQFGWTREFSGAQFRRSTCTNDGESKLWIVSDAL